MRIARLLLRLYPRAWRKRYGRELLALVEDCGPSARSLLNLVRGGLVERGRAIMSGGTFGVVRREPWVLTPVIIGVVVAGVIAFAWQDQYYASGVLRVSEGASEYAFEQRVARAVRAALTRGNLKEAITSNGLYEQELQKQPLDDIIDQMKRDVLIGGVKGKAHTFNVGFRYPDRSLAQKVAADVMKTLMKTDPTFELVNDPTLPKSPIAPNRPNIVIAGMLVGALMVVPILIWRVRRYSRAPAIQ